MSISMTANLVLIPLPTVGHFTPAFELASRLVSRNPRLSVTVLVIQLPFPDDKLHSYLQSLHSNPSLLNHGVQFLEMPLLENIDLATVEPGPGFISLYLDAYRSIVKHAVQELIRSSGPTPIAGFLLDMFCTTMIDVATDLGLPSYIFFPSNASMLNMMFHLQGSGVDVAEEYDLIRDPNATIEVPGFTNPVPVRVWPGKFLAKGSVNILGHAERFRQAKGILVNTFTGPALEREVIHYMSRDNRIPPIYPVGPILNLNPPADGLKTEDAIIRWLDGQPHRSVVFLCFGSMGSFDEAQVKEIAAGLERSGRRFLWSLRRRPEKNDGSEDPSEFDDPSSVLPEGFLERTAERGRVTGWAPQARVLGHVAIGGFVSHCGWNSTLESLWFGVPIATWPLYAEQQLNAFLLVREMGLAAEIKMDYRQYQSMTATWPLYAEQQLNAFLLVREMGLAAEIKMDYRQYQSMTVEAAKVEEGIEKVIEDGELRKSVKEMSNKARKVLGDGGSSYVSLGQFIDSVFMNLALLRSMF